LRAGLDADHASLGALITTQTDRDGLGRMIVTSILENSDVARRGLDIDDEMVSFDGRPITTVNHFKNVLGLFPRGWRVPLEYRRGDKKDADDRGRKEILASLMGVQRKEIRDPNDKGPKQPPMPGQKPLPPSPAAKYYDAKPGFANYYFNQQERDRLLAALKKQADFGKQTGDWTLE